jgi:hypothetical protein
MSQLIKETLVTPKAFRYVSMASFIWKAVAQIKFLLTPNVAKM